MILSNNWFMKTIKYVIIALWTLLSISKLNAQAPTNGLVAYYPFNGNANDESGNGNHGSVTGAVLNLDKEGKSNSAYYFNGSSSFISVAHSSSLNLTTEATFSAWVKFESKGTTHQKIVDKITDGTSDGYLMDVGSYNPSTLRFIGGTQSGIGYDYIYDGNVDFSIWKHVAITFNSQTVKLYINGVLENVITTNGSNIQTNNNPLIIGASNNFHPNYFTKGSMDEIRIYNRALSDTEILAVYNNTIPDFTNLTSGLVAYYPFNGNANDESGNGLNGTVNGASLTTDKDGNANQAYFFNGTSSTISVASFPQFFTGNFSISLWLKNTGSTGRSYDSFISIGEGFGTHSFNFAFDRDNSNFSYWDKSNSSYFFSNGADAVIDKWAHITIVYNNGTMTNYVNGVALSTKPVSNITPQSSTTLNIGSFVSDVQYFYGNIDDIRIYNRALNNSEILALKEFIPSFNCNIKPIVTISNDRMTTQETQGVDYQWYRNGIPVNYTNNYIYKGTYLSGKYTVSKTANGCTANSDTFNLIVLASCPPASYSIITIYDGTTSLSPENPVKVVVAPNPTVDKLKVITYNIQPGYVDVIDLNGITVLSNQSFDDIDVSNLANGMYFLKIFNNQNTLVKTVKIMKN
jgi:hypothetical protein